MRIGFEAKRAFHNFSGLGRYSRLLLQGLATQYPVETYHLFSPQVKPHPQSDFLRAGAPFHLHEGPRLGGSVWRRYRLASLAQREGVEVFHGLSHELPLGLKKRGISSVLSVHDLIFHHYPQDYPWMDRQMYAWKLRRSCADADLLLAMSEATRQDLIQWYEVPAEKIQVAYQTCAAHFWEPCTAEQLQAVRDRYDLPEVFLLSVGSDLPRKNIGLILSAMQAFDSPPLVMVGGKKTLPAVWTAESRGLNHRLIRLGHVSDADLPALYQLAHVFLYPSRYEGFGIPILEAMASGTPVICSGTSSLPEVGGNAARYIDPTQVESLKEAMQEVLADQELQDQMRKKGKAQAQRFSASALTHELMSHYQSLV